MMEKSKIKNQKSKLQFKIKNFEFCIVILLFALCILNFLGCAALSKTARAPEGPTLLEPQAILKFGDIPLPAGFKLSSSDSYAFESSGVRVGLLKYQGKAQADAVVAFYKEQMPMYNWQFLNMIEYGERLLNFEREDETCIIRLLPKGSTTLITISLGPKSPGLKKSSKPVK
jgi:hypothetical protein